MAWRIEALTVPKPSGTPPPEIAKISHAASQAMLPTPPRSTGVVSARIAAAAVSASTGSVNST